MRHVADEGLPGDVIMRCRIRRKFSANWPSSSLRWISSEYVKSSLVIAFVASDSSEMGWISRLVILITPNRLTMATATINPASIIWISENRILLAGLTNRA